MVISESEKWKSLSRVQLFSTPRSIQSMEFSQPEYWSGQPFPSSGDLPNPGVKPRSPPLQVDSFPAEPQGSPRILEWVAYPFFSESSQLGKQTRVFCIAGRFFTSWATREALSISYIVSMHIYTYICQPQSPNSLHLSPFPLGIHTFILDIHVCISALQTRSSTPFF